MSELRRRSLTPANVVIEVSLEMTAALVDSLAAITWQVMKQKTQISYLQTL